MENINMLIVHTDGGARGNPGPAGIGVLIEMDKPMNSATENPLKISKYIGLATNNQAEYQAVVEALQYLAKNYKGQEIVAQFYLDSQLVVEQLNGNYKMKNEGLKPLFSEARNLIMQLGGRISFSHIPREKNKIADELVNKAIDGALN